MLTGTAGVPMPGKAVFDASERRYADLWKVHGLLTGPAATVRVVLTPESAVQAEARWSWTTLSLYSYRVDGVVVNRVFSSGGDEWRAAGCAAGRPS